MKAVFSSRFRQACTLVFIFSLVMLYSPLIMLAIESFRAVPEVFGGPRGWTFLHYQKLFSDQVWNDWVGPIELSLGLGAICALGATFLGLIAAYQLKDSKGWVHKVWWSAIQVPLVFPEILLALAFLVWFAQMGLPLGTVTIAIAHITFSLIFSALILGARLQQLDPLWREAARDLGASPQQVFFKIDIPFLVPSIVSSFLMAFSLSWDDFLITFFVAGPQSQTLPMKLYSMLKFGIHPEVIALSNILVLINLVVLLVAFRGIKNQELKK